MESHAHIQSQQTIQTVSYLDTGIEYFQILDIRVTEVLINLFQIDEITLIKTMKL